jgi:hypothetical protein
MKEGDVILTLNGKVMENARQLEVNLYRHAIGDRVSLEVLRGAENLKVDVAVGARDPDPERFSASVSVEKNRVPRLGVLGITLDAKIARELPPLRKHEGVLVAARVATAFPGEEQLLPGDVIYAVSRVPQRLGRIAVKCEYFERSRCCPVGAPGQVRYPAFGWRTATSLMNQRVGFIVIPASGARAEFAASFNDFRDREERSGFPLLRE